ncbi:SOS response associated peptidase (SRAP) [Nitrospirillum pindoramense]|uniref:Abasic site processing protein n=2 Tax=Nitrospirillum amazonense TaxID=28077 RepID=A0A560H8B8_9PROT|nr:SOS response associated peptidase (SRAP) [Nitrospirillum amazonense]
MLMRSRLHPDTGERHLGLLRWGLVPSFAKDMSGAAKCINARADTVASKPSFRTAFKKGRCLVPTNSYFEWQVLSDGGKQPYAIGLANDPMMAFAGLWECWKNPASEEWIHTYSIRCSGLIPLGQP